MNYIFVGTGAERTLLNTKILYCDCTAGFLFFLLLLYVLFLIKNSKHFLIKKSKATKLSVEDNAQNREVL